MRPLLATSLALCGLQGAVSRAEGPAFEPARATRVAAPATLPVGTSRWVTEPLLGAALDGPAQSAAAHGERADRLAEHATWMDTDGPSPNAVSLIARVGDAGAHGLDPAHYDHRGLRDAVANVFENPSSDDASALDSPERAALAYRFERAFTRLATDLGRGLVDARSIQRRFFRDRPDPDIDALRQALFRGELDVEAALDTVTPDHVRYRRLAELSRRLLAERATGVTRTRVADEEPLWLGDRHADVSRLKRRLVETGDLPTGTALTPGFDAGLVTAMEAFQTRQGIAREAVVDPATRAALNRTLEDDLDDLAMSLERWRWMPRELGELNVLVNLPDYRLSVTDGGESIADMAVVIGSAKHPTPVFSREMSYLEFNPTWTVPASIAHAELLPMELGKPGYLAERGFDFFKYRDGKLVEVPYGSVSREDLARRPFYYVLRQRGGGGNALGRMKFMMPNPYAIYLHDTPAKQLFARHDRAYSHGCIRLEDPDGLASLLLRIDGREHTEITALIDGGRTRRTHFDTPVPTHLAYFTAWADADGRLQRRSDVYAYDPALRDALGATGTLPSARFAPPAQPN